MIPLWYVQYKLRLAYGVQRIDINVQFPINFMQNITDYIMKIQITLILLQ